MTSFVRYRAGEDRRTPLNQMQPLAGDHPAVGRLCWVCDVALAPGDRPALWAVGPLPESAAKHDEGRWYPALALLCHQSCLWPANDREDSGRVQTRGQP